MRKAIPDLAEGTAPAATDYIEISRAGVSFKVPLSALPALALVRTSTDVIYTLTAADNGYVILYNGAGQGDWTYPPGLGANHQCVIVRIGSYDCKMSPGAGVDLGRGPYPTHNATGGAGCSMWMLAVEANEIRIDGTTQELP
jgi:hypothetical protein